MIKDIAFAADLGWVGGLFGTGAVVFCDASPKRIGEGIIVGVATGILPHAIGNWGYFIPTLGYGVKLAAEKELMQRVSQFCFELLEDSLS